MSIFGFNTGSLYTEANRLKMANLTEIVKCRYPNICFNYSDLYYFLNVPFAKKAFYKFYRAGDKSGVFNINGYQTFAWQNFRLDQGFIRIATGTPTNLDKGWSDPFSIMEESSPLTIYKFVKMKAFW